MYRCHCEAQRNPLPSNHATMRTNQLVTFSENNELSQKWGQLFIVTLIKPSFNERSKLTFSQDKIIKSTTAFMKNRQANDLEQTLFGMSVFLIHSSAFQVKKSLFAWSWIHDFVEFTEFVNKRLSIEQLEMTDMQQKEFSTSAPNLHN